MGSINTLESGPIGPGTTGEIARIYIEDFQTYAMNTTAYSLDQ